MHMTPFMNKLLDLYYPAVSNFTDTKENTTMPYTPLNLVDVYPITYLILIPNNSIELIHIIITIIHTNFNINQKAPPFDFLYRLSYFLC